MKMFLIWILVLFSVTANAQTWSSNTLQWGGAPGNARLKYSSSQVGLSNDAGVTSVPLQTKTSSSLLHNLGLTASVAANALTIAMKQSDASTNAAATSPVTIGFRNATTATGDYAMRTVTGALSLVVSSGSTLGQASAAAQYIFVYAIDNAGTVELAISSSVFDDGSIVSTTAEGGAGAADSNRVMYSTTARSNVACRLIGRLLSTQATAGTWASSITQISLTPFQIPVVAVNYYNTAGTSFTGGAGAADLPFATKVTDSRNAFASPTFTAPEPGYYIFTVQVYTGAAGFTATQGLVLSAVVNGVTQLWFQKHGNGSTVAQSIVSSKGLQLAAGDTVKFSLDVDLTVALNTTANRNSVTIVKVPGI